MKKVILVILLLLVLKPNLQAQAPTYQGKTVTIVVGTVAGDLYDLYARVIALIWVNSCLETPMLLFRICREPVI